MKWSEVRKLYPNQFVKLKSLSSHIKDGQEIIDDMAVISPVSDEMATKELLKSKGDELVYHTIHENIVLEIRQDVGFVSFLCSLNEEKL
ncbi:hypothetical protein KHA80_22600 [Anaerobacillus sp. HL2]|nr:hypothetical protein KHA80_22600 [Anaerobacillus sp. HL2]